MAFCQVEQIFTLLCSEKGTEKCAARNNFRAAFPYFLRDSGIFEIQKKIAIFGRAKFISKTDFSNHYSAGITHKL